MRTERFRVLPALVAASLFVGLVAVLSDVPLAGDAVVGIEGTTTDAIGVSVFDDFLASFELVALLLVAALVAGVYLAKPEESRRDAVREAVGTKPRIETDKEDGTGVDDGTE